MPHIPMEYTVDLGKTINVTPLHTLFAMGDDNAHRFAFSVVQDGKPVDLSGCTVLATYTNFSPHGMTVNLDGKIEDGKAVALLSKACYTMEGRFAIVVRLKNSSGTSAIFYGDGYMIRTTADTVIDGDYIIYDVNTLLEKIAEINEATSSANAAAQSANTAAETANAAASNAQEKADMANTAAQGASGWANTTMSATGLPAGSAPTATVTTASDGHKVITLGIPKGDTSATPQISVQVETGEPGSEAQVSVSGTAEEPVIHLTIPKGDTGDIGALTINGKTPDAGGAVTLTADDLGAATAEEVSQLKDDKLDKTATAADSAKLCGRAPEYYIQPRNLLDNSYWEMPSQIVNQRGYVSGNALTAWKYFIDRWMEYTGGTGNTFTFDTSGGLVNGDVVQKIENNKIISGNTYTYAVYYMDGTVICASGVVTTGLDEWTSFASEVDGDIKIFLFSDNTEYIGVSYMDVGSKRIKAHALYEGSYGADTLPPYVPKGYAAELAGCQRYYVPNVGKSITGYINSSGKVRVSIPVPVVMRKTPTVTANVLDNAVCNYGGSPIVIPLTSCAVEGKKANAVDVLFETNLDAGKYQFNQATLVSTSLDFSADL